MVLSIEERVFLVEYIFQEGNRYTDLVQELAGSYSTRLLSVGRSKICSVS
jgi:hypothetical protein